VNPLAAAAGGEAFFFGAGGRGGGGGIELAAAVPLAVLRFFFCIVSHAFFSSYCNASILSWSLGLLIHITLPHWGQLFPGKLKNVFLHMSQVFFGRTAFK